MAAAEQGLVGPRVQWLTIGSAADDSSNSPLPLSVSHRPSVTAAPLCLPVSLSLSLPPCFAQLCLSQSRMLLLSTILSHSPSLCFCSVFQSACLSQTVCLSLCLPLCLSLSLALLMSLSLCHCCSSLPACLSQSLSACLPRSALSLACPLLMLLCRCLSVSVAASLSDNIACSPLHNQQLRACTTQERHERNDRLHSCNPKQQHARRVSRSMGGTDWERSQVRPDQVRQPSCGAVDQPLSH